ncbi:MAG: (Fe-S)-binding protein [Sulfolobales archaeon]
MNCSPDTFPHYLFTQDLKPLVYIELVLSLIFILGGLFYYYYKYFRDYSLRVFFIFSWNNFYRFIRYVFLQKKVLEEVLPGSLHFGIFYGFLILIVATLVRAVDYYYSEYTGTHLVYGYSYAILKLIFDLGGLLALAGLLIALYRRIARLTKDLPNTLEDLTVLVVLIVIVLSGFILEGVTYTICRSSWPFYYNPVGYLFTHIFSSYDTDRLILVYRATWIFHLTVALITISVTPYTKLSHILFSSLNVYYSTELLKPETTYKPVADIDRRIEERGYVGVKKLRDTTWLQRLNYLACIKCARCHNNCPAVQSGKILSPMKLITDLRSSMDDNKWDTDLVPTIIDPEVVWSCVTCGACIRACPVLINHVETIADIRRSLMSTGENTPNEVLSLSYNIMRVGNPYGYNPVERENWISELVSRGLVEFAEEDREYDILYWIGCNTSYDPNLRRVAEDLLEILRSLNLRVAVLRDETCCGEPARRIGDELTFREIAKNNYEKLSKYKFKKLLLSCPHGYTVFRRDYNSLGLRISADIVHHTQLLSELIEKGLIRPGELRIRATYHDPCYLGRWNGVYEEPRKIIRSVRGLDFVEMPRSREKSFCCGGGGGHAFFEIKRGVRISRLRVEEAHRTGAGVLVTSCPICNTMLRAEASEYNLEVVDIATLLKRSMTIR